MPPPLHTLALAEDVPLLGQVAVRNGAFVLHVQHLVPRFQEASVHQGPQGNSPGGPLGRRLAGGPAPSRRASLRYKLPKLRALP